MTSFPPATPGRVGFVTSLGRDETAVNSSSFSRYTSPLSRDREASSGEKQRDTGYCPDDYDNTATVSDDDDRQPTGVSQRSTVHRTIFPSAHPTDLHSEKSTQRASAPSTKPRTAIKSSEEESLDQLVAHLLGEGTPVSSPTMAQSASSDGQPSSTGVQTWSSLRWPQGDSLPRVEMRRPIVVGHYDVAGSSGVHGKLVTEELSADENDNIVKNVNVTEDGVFYDVSTSQVNAPVDTPPLPTIRKQSTPAAATNSVTCSVDVATWNDRRTPAELVSELSLSPSSERGGKDGEGRDYTMSTNRDTRHVQMSPMSDAERLHNESDRLQNESKLDATRSDVGLLSPIGADVQQTSLLDQFKALRLDVLTSTSQLLSCVSGTWKRGESFRSKLTTILQLCVALRTSVSMLETFLQSALSTASLSATSSPLVDAANTRIKNLHAVQTSIDAFIETLDGENLAGTTNKSDLKVGGIIHLTKEIPGLVRTFAPVVEYLASTQPDLNASLVAPHETNIGDRTEVYHQHYMGMHIDSEARQQKELLEEKTNNEYDDERNLTQHGAAVYLVRPEPSRYLDIQNDQEIGLNPDVHHVQVSMTSTDPDHQFVILQSSQSTTEKRSWPVITDSTQEVETTSTSAHSGITTVISHNDVKNTPVVPSCEKNDMDRVEYPEHRSREPVLPVLPVNVENATPPTPPPKLRVASHYHASLGITNSMTNASSPVTATTTTTTTTATTTTGRCDDDRIATTCNVARLPVGEINVTASDDKFQLTNWQPDDRVDGSSTVPTTSDINYYVTGGGEEIDLLPAEDQTPYRFPRATETTSSFQQQQSTVVLRRPAAEQADVDVDDRQYRVSESELETPDFRASGVSQTTVEQLEALQRQANAQAVIMHTDTTAGFDHLVIGSPNPHYQSTLSADDRRLLMFYCDQMTGHWNVLDHAASAFFHCMDRRQPPKVFVSHSKFVIVAGHKMAYLGDVLARNIEDSNARDWIVAHSNRLCTSLKTAVRATKEAALAYPAVPAQQQMVDCIKEVTDWAIELKEVVDRLAYIGRPDHILT